MNRYDSVNINKDSNGRRYRTTTKLPIIEPSLDDTYIIGQIGDRLDNLAFKYYGDSSLWWIIARANNIGKGDFTVPLGQQIRIPANEYGIIEQYNLLNKGT